MIRMVALAAQRYKVFAFSPHFYKNYGTHDSSTINVISSLPYQRSKCAGQEVTIRPCRVYLANHVRQQGRLAAFRVVHTPAVGHKPVAHREEKRGA